MPKHPTTKPAAVDYFKVPRRLWRLMKKHLPAERQPSRLGGRPRIGNRAVLNGIWYVLWTGCQWKAVHRDWFGVSSSVLHERFQTWQEQGIWAKVFETLVKFYRRERHIQWQWQVDQRGAPLAIHVSGANQHDKWSVAHLVFHIAVKRPTSEQHFCADEGYDYEDVFDVVLNQGYVPHIKHRCLKNEPPDPYPVPGELRFPARR